MRAYFKYHNRFIKIDGKLISLKVNRIVFKIFISSQPDCSIENLEDLFFFTIF